MSRIGKSLIALPQKVTVKQNSDEVTVKGPLGELKMVVVGMMVRENEGKVSVDVSDKSMFFMWGTTRSKLASMVKGVSTGYEKVLELKGVGIKASQQDGYLFLSLGKSHDFAVATPPDVQVKVSQNSVVVSGIDKIRVSKVSAMIVRLMPVEPYKGKGIRYTDKTLYMKDIRKS